jgi:hypothetical protein
MLRRRSAAKCTVPPANDVVLPVRVIPWAARSRKSTVWPPSAPLTAIVTWLAPATAMAIGGMTGF